MKSHVIEEYMTPSPQTIGEDIPLSIAMEMMRERHIRHLPVQSAGRLVGVLSDRDIKLALTVHPAGKDLQVGDIMTEDPYCVSPDCPLEEVARAMADNKFGCALVVNERGRAIGIFTANDGLEVLSEQLREMKSYSTGERAKAKAL